MQDTQDKTYNGWTNYETWAVGMFLDGNYEGEWCYRHFLEVVNEAYEGAEETSYWTLEEARRFAVEDALKKQATALIEGDEGIPGVAGDLLRAALDEVNWRELAEAKIRDRAEA